MSLLYTRSQLKEEFKTGTLSTEDKFARLIDSVYNRVEDSIMMGPLGYVGTPGLIGPSGATHLGLFVGYGTDYTLGKVVIGEQNIRFYGPNSQDPAVILTESGSIGRITLDTIELRYQSLEGLTGDQKSGLTIGNINGVTSGGIYLDSTGNLIYGIAGNYKSVQSFPIEMSDSVVPIWSSSASNFINSNIFVNLQDGYVGIGKTGAAFPLDVSGDINFDGTLYHNGEIYKSSQWIDNQDLSIYYPENVGIGVTTSDTIITDKLYVNGTARFLNGDISIGSTFSIGEIELTTGASTSAIISSNLLVLNTNLSANNTRSSIIGITKTNTGSTFSRYGVSGIIEIQPGSTSVHSGIRGIAGFGRNYGTGSVTSLSGGYFDSINSIGASTSFIYASQFSTTNTGATAYVVSSITATTLNNTGSSAGWLYGGRFSITNQDGSTATYINGLDSLITNNSYRNTETQRGLNINSIYAGTGNVSNLMGANIISENKSSGTVTNQWGISSNIFNTGTGTIQSLRGLSVYYKNTGSGSVNALYGISIGGSADAWVTNGTTLTSYGIYIGASTAIGQTSYSIYSESSAQSYIKGNVSIGTTSSTQKLTVDGNIRVTGSIYDSTNSAGNDGEILVSTPTGINWKALPEIFGVTGYGITNYIVRWTDQDTLEPSSITDAGGTVSIGPSATTDLVINGRIQSKGTILTQGTGIDQLITYTKLLVLDGDWQDVGINGADLETGTYIIQLYANDAWQGGSNNNEYYSGTMSWWSGQVTNPMELPNDEIPLHRSGGGADGGLYLRTLKYVPEIGQGYIKLQIYSNFSNVQASNYVFKFRRFI